MIDLKEKNYSHRFCTAPMIDWSDRHCRYLWRLLSRHARLYTEMLTTGALLHGDRNHLLQYDACEQPLALQLGGSDPQALAQCAKMAQQAGYVEINLNCGCPSDRVQQGMMGACLMQYPDKVAHIYRAMQAQVDIEVTIKHRIGIDHITDYQYLVDFIGPIAQAGCRTFIVHARNAWLQGLSPKENREIPPLNYSYVYRLKQAFPHLNVILNGGIRTLVEAKAHLEKVDGVMLGRECYHNPYLLAEVDGALFSAQEDVPSRKQVAQTYLLYCERQLSQGVKLHHMTRHLLGLFHAQKGGRQFRRYISENIHRKHAGLDVLYHALDYV